LLARLDEDETDRGPAAARRDVERLCLATREKKPISEMIRYVVGPDGTIVPDLKGRLPGRGGWVTANRSALDTAIRRKAFGRAFRGSGTVRGDLPRLVEDLLEQAAFETLSLANKAGQLVTGFSKMSSVLAERPVAAVIHASDASPEQSGKLDSIAAASARARSSAEPPRISHFSGEQLDLALGRSNVVHAALLEHPTSRKFLDWCQRLEHWRVESTAGPHAFLKQTDTESGPE
jgi:predicted RNA-binding protein YlxR (DUF448 family)